MKCNCLHTSTVYLLFVVGTSYTEQRSLVWSSRLPTGQTHIVFHQTMEHPSSVSFSLNSQWWQIHHIVLSSWRCPNIPVWDIDALVGFLNLLVSLPLCAMNLIGKIWQMLFSLPRPHCWIFFFFLFELYLCSKPPKGQEVNAIYCRSWYCGKFCKNAWTDQLVECFCFARNVFANTVNQPRLKKQNPKDLGFKQRPTQPIHCYPSSCTIVSSQHWRKTSKEQDLSLTKFLKKGHECNMSLV